MTHTLSLNQLDPLHAGGGAPRMFDNNVSFTVQSHHEMFLFIDNALKIWIPQFIAITKKKERRGERVSLVNLFCLLMA